MDLDRLFKALGEPIRRRLLDELAERDGQTLYELNVRLISWHGTAVTRQALSKHLAVLEKAGLVRAEWRWRSKHHFIVREPMLAAWRIWLGPLAEGRRAPAEREKAFEDRRDERDGG